MIECVEDPDVDLASDDIENEFDHLSDELDDEILEKSEEFHVALSAMTESVCFHIVFRSSSTRS